MENLKIYNDLRVVPKEAQKPFNNGRFSGTDINPMWRIKKMTEEFGACGVGWYVDVVERHLEKSPDGNTICAFVAIKLYIKIDGEWSKPIYGEGGNSFVKNNFTSDEAFKMAYTDALSNATKMIGLGADIWFEKDLTKYTVQQPEQPLNDIQKRHKALEYVKGNSNVLSYALKKYNHEEVYQITDIELVEIYNGAHSKGLI